MSVWADTCYIDNAAQTVFQSFDPIKAVNTPLIDILNFEIDDPGEFKIPFAGRNPLLALMEGKMDEKAFFRKKSKVQLPGAINTFKNLINLSYGLNAVYKFVDYFYDKIFTRSTFNSDNMRFIRHLYHYYGATGLLTPKDVVERLVVAIDVLQDYVLNAYAVIIELKKIFAMKNKFRRLHGYTEEEPLKRVRVNVPSLSGIVWAHLGYRYVILTDRAGTRGFLFTDKDLDRLRAVICGLACYLLHAAMYNKARLGVNQVQLERAKEVIKVLRKAMKKCNRRTANLVCRAFDVVYHLFLGKRFNSVSDRAEKEQRDKLAKEKLDRVVDSKRLLEIVEGVPFLDAQELLMIHRCLPCPDFDQYSMMNKQSKLYEGSVNRKEHDPTGEILAHIYQNYEVGMLLAYRKKHGMFPGRSLNPTSRDPFEANYPFVPGVSIDKLHLIDYGGTFLFSSREYDIADLVKDKAVCPKNIGDIKDVDNFLSLPVVKRSQLLDVYSREEPIVMSNLRARVKELSVHVKADDKGEAKKPNGRMFFEAGTEWRLLQSEYEDSVANYINQLDQVVFGKNEHDKRKNMNFLCAPPAMTGEKQVLFISFDLHRWSPWMHSDIHKALDRLWAKAFGMNHLKHMHRIFTEGNIHYIKQGVHHVMPKKGRDFEGFAGKKLTLFHYAVMRTAVQQMQAEGLIEAGPRFAAQIDDGLLRVSFPLNFNPVDRIVAIIEKVYGAAGLKISWDKTYIDTTWSVFLNEVRCYSTPMFSGVRAFLKMNDRTDVPVTSIFDDLNLLESRARGALTTGCHMYTVLTLLIFLVTDLLRKWFPKHHRLKAEDAIYVFVPVALGGLGLSNTLTLTGALGGKPLSDGVGNLKRIVMRFPDLREAVNKLINQPMKQKEMKTMLSAPFTIMRDNAVFVAGRLSNAVLSALSRGGDKPGFVNLYKVSNVARSETGQIAADIGAVLNLHVMSLMYKASPEAALQSIADKFLKSSSLRWLVGARKLIRVQYANFVNVSKVVATWV